MSDEQHDAEEYIEAIEDGCRTTKEIADAVGVTRQGADYRLRRLRNQGRVDAEKLGGTLVWSVLDR